MEIAIWAFIFVILVLVFKVLKYEKGASRYYEKELLEQYLAIKKMPPDYRLDSLKKWEASVQDFVQEKEPRSSVAPVVSLSSFKASK